LTVPPPPTSPERRLPLRQPPSERSFSASPRYVDPVSNDWVFPLLKDEFSLLSAQGGMPFVLCQSTKFVTFAVTLSVFLSQNSAI
jgi:hypothetical protein